ncbi:divergent polysaccharide deacetylase family protein [Lichenifustis flavocetrariae]|uniref:Divergent polysaccharide deacetylase family protein n=1 Tax=Lichenifustis flavocetrariae TaxID=2949735 RepID=A0AA41YXT4_9HYPH|nr:divergent polysaccharide deacetylase family protein [Lichenifustis flavocetrariae]MCW6510104.1 divergent polysaccharide deacetylase family protein [Lichenifustis flavocetrariae]
MTRDELYEPLGRKPDPVRPRSLIPIHLVLGLGCIAALGAWFLWPVRPQPPKAIAVSPVVASDPVKPVPKAPPSKIDASTASVEPPPKSALSAAEAEHESGVKVVRPPGSSAFPGTFIPVPQTETLALAPAPDSRLVERGRYGFLPRRAPDGTRPADVYARPVSLDGALGTHAPRIALFVGGMGLNRMLTAAAAQALPPAVTFGFAPYGGDLGQQVENTRALGHEAVLQVPMESFNASDGSSMPRLLETADPARVTLDNLHWQMSRFSGYVGVSSFLGGKFTADAAAFSPVLKDIAARGLFYLDDGTAPRNLAATLGPSLGVPTLRADVVIDALGEPEAIDAGLKKLEAVARSKGSALGATTGLPTTVDRVAAFATALAGRGIALVPASALAPDAPQRSGP